jgi:prepilin-type N-terminal cleavage/methylation domain-containing protein
LEKEVIARYHKSMKDKDQGFTLIELLVVIVIIGILAAIAIPTFLNQRKKGVDTSLKSDLKTAATTVETWVTDNPSVAISPTTAAATSTVAGTGSLAGVKVSSGNSLTLKAHATVTGAYCIFASNPGASAATGATQVMAYMSESGGMQKDPVAVAAACT